MSNKQQESTNVWWESTRNADCALLFNRSDVCVFRRAPLFDLFICVVGVCFSPFVVYKFINSFYLVIILEHFISFSLTLRFYALLFCSERSHVKYSHENVRVYVFFRSSFCLFAHLCVKLLLIISVLRPWIVRSTQWIRVYSMSAIQSVIINRCKICFAHTERETKHIVRA